MVLMPTNTLSQAVMVCFFGDGSYVWYHAEDDEGMHRFFAQVNTHHDL